MTLMEDLISSLQGDAPVREVFVGPFWTAVVSRQHGLASTVFAPEAPHGQQRVRDAGNLEGGSALAMAHLAFSESSLERGLGVAVINSLIEVDGSRCVELQAAQWLRKHGAGKRVALVGHFPFVPRLRQDVGRLDVLELRPREGDLPASEAVEVIPKADVVAITGSALVNGTLEGLLALCPPGARVMVLGPSTPLSPVWFDHGVHVIAGAQVVDPDLVMRYVRQAAHFREFRGARLLTMASGV